MSLKDNLPTDAFYSAWYYLPHSTTVNGYWVIQKFRRRTDPADPSTEGELFDLDLYTLPSGEMSFRVFDHRTASNLPMLVDPPIVPVDGWFLLEARYRNASDATGRLTVWLGSLEVIDLAGATGPSPWIQWAVSSVGQDLTPTANVLYVDDCAIAEARIGRSRAVAGPLTGVATATSLRHPRIRAARPGRHFPIARRGPIWEGCREDPRCAQSSCPSTVRRLHFSCRPFPIRRPDRIKSWCEWPAPA